MDRVFREWGGYALFIATPWLIGCAGLFEVQGGVNTAPANDGWKTGGMMAAHLGMSEEVDKPLFGLGGTVKVDVNESYGLFEQGLHLFYLEEVDDGWAWYGRAGGLAGVSPLELSQFSISAFLQCGTMACVDASNNHCISLGAQTQFNALVSDTFKSDPWVGIYLGYGEWWVR